MGDRKQPTPCPDGLLKPDPPPAPPAKRYGRAASAWSEWGDGHDYSRTGKHDPNECRKCLKVIINRLEAQPFADRMVQAESRVATLVSIARRAVNGWACYAKRNIEHDEIAGLHRAIESALQIGVDGGASAQPGTDMPANTDSRSLSPSAPSPRAEIPEATVVEPWKPVRIGKKHTYFQCPRCLVARVTEWCPPPCNTQSLAFKRTKESR